jgi:hypothetical protein
MYVKTVARDDSLFIRFRQFVSFEIIQKNVFLHVNYIVRRHNIHGNKMGINEIIAINDIYKISPSVYFVSEGQIAQSATVILGQDVMYRTSSLAQ